MKTPSSSNTLRRNTRALRHRLLRSELTTSNEVVKNETAEAIQMRSVVTVSYGNM